MMSLAQIFATGGFPALGSEIGAYIRKGSEVSKLSPETQAALFQEIRKNPAQVAGIPQPKPAILSLGFTDKILLTAGAVILGGMIITRAMR